MSTSYETLISRFIHPSATEPGFSGFLLFNPLKPSGNYMYHLLHQSVIVHSVFMGLL